MHVMMEQPTAMYTRTTQLNFHDRESTPRRIDDVRPFSGPIKMPEPEVHHIPIAESVEVKTKYSPLSAYMVNSKYINPDAPTLPKRPLGQERGQTMRQERVQTWQPSPTREQIQQARPIRTINQRQAVFHDRLAGQETMDRIRRPMRLAVAAGYAPLAAAGGTAYTGRHEEGPSLLTKVGAFLAPVAAFFVLAKDKLFGSKDHLAKAAGHMRGLDPRVHYTALQGAVTRTYGMRASWFRVAVPLFVLASVLTVVAFNNVLAPSSETDNPAVTDNSAGTSDGTTSVPLGSSDGSPSQGATSPQNGTGIAGQMQGANGSGLQSSGVDPSTGLPVGGRGGGSALSSGGSFAPSLSTGGGSAPSSGGGSAPSAGGGTAPLVTTGSNTPAEALPVPAGAGSALPDTPLPLPATVTVPPVNSSADGKTIVDSSGTTLTIN